ncbi:MAG TPA: outer membrane protein assembly factor BamA [Candidatus Alistipes merdipullorum]|nr:outer membrane protein assembly factor BamA [Candidatus Alistipes merdipullorum]
MRYAGKQIVAVAAALLLMAGFASAQTQDTVRVDKTDREAEQSLKEQNADKQQQDEDEEEDDGSHFDRNAPVMSAEAEPHLYYIRKVNVYGVRFRDKNLLLSTSGLIPGDSLYLPSTFISDAITRLWNQRYFSDVEIGAEIEGDSIDLNVFLQERPRVRSWSFEGEHIGRSKQKDLMDELKLKAGTELSDYVIDKNEKLIKKHFISKGFRNVDVSTRIENDSIRQNMVNVTFRIDRNEKVRVGSITFSGNTQFKERRLRRTFKKTHQKSINFFQNTKLNEEDYKEDKNLLIDFYNSQGYRNATILSDSVYAINPERIGIHIDLSEGDKFYIRNIKWIGNSIYPTDELQQIFGVKKGDTYDKKSMHKRLGIGREMDPDGMSVANLYQNNGYLMSQIEPSEIVVGKDSIDLEIKVFEGKPFTVNEVGISGNNRVDDEVIRRELYVFPGELYNRALLMRTLRMLMSMGHFDAEQLQPDIQPVSSDKVNVNFPLVETASDQFNVAGGWGSGSFVGSVGITLNNLSTRNLFKKGTWTPYPMGQNQKFSISGQTNGTYYKAIAASFTDPWVGGHKPNSLTVSGHWSEQNNAYYVWQSATMYFRSFGLAAGLGKRLKWPDPNFSLYLEAQYTRYSLKNWNYFIMSNGVANELSFKVALSRSTVDQPIYPRSGSEFSAVLTLTPPYSLWDGRDYSDSSMPDRTRYKWIEYHRWQFNARWFLPISRNNKFVLMAAAEMGFLGHYNKNKVSPFERFEVGGDGMSGYTIYGVDIIRLRGYENGALDPTSDYSIGYNKYTMELRYPVILKESSQIYVLGFLEGGNGYSSWKDFSPFRIKRSAGLGVRIYLPIVGLLGLDWGWGFDAPAGSTRRSGSQFHFTMGQTF